MERKKNARKGRRRLKEDDCYITIVGTLTQICMQLVCQRRLHVTGLGCRGFKSGRRNLSEHIQRKINMSSELRGRDNARTVSCFWRDQERAAKMIARISARPSKSDNCRRPIVLNRETNIWLLNSWPLPCSFWISTIFLLFLVATKKVRFDNFSFRFSPKSTGRKKKRKKTLQPRLVMTGDSEGPRNELPSGHLLVSTPIFSDLGRVPFTGKVHFLIKKIYTFEKLMITLLTCFGGVFLRSS